MEIKFIRFTTQSSILIHLFNLQEELYLQEAIRQSLTDNTPKKAPAPKVNPPPAEADLLDFDSPPAQPVSQPSSNPYDNRISSWGAGFPSTDGRVDTYGSAPPPNNPVVGSNPYGPSTGLGSTIPTNTTSAASTQPDSNFGALVPSNTPSNPYGAAVSSNLYASVSNPYAPPTSAPNSNPFAAPGSSAPNPFSQPNNQFGGQATVAAFNPSVAADSSTANPYASTAGSSSNPYSTSIPSNNYSANPYDTPAGNNPYSSQAPSGNVPAPIVTNMFGSQNVFSDPSIPPTVTPKAQETPSTIGFGSPPPEFSFSSPEPKNYQRSVLGGEVQTSQQTNTLSMNSFDHQNQETTSSNSASVGLDQAFSKLVNLDTFSLGSKKDDARSNPFDKKSINSTVGGSQSLADLQKNKVSVLRSGL